MGRDRTCGAGRRVSRLQRLEVTDASRVRRLGFSQGAFQLPDDFDDQIAVEYACHQSKTHLPAKPVEEAGHQNGAEVGGRPSQTLHTYRVSTFV